MERNHVLGMICGYFLSRLDRAAYVHLGLPTQQATHELLGVRLGVPAESIKNWRDEFDPVHPNARLGWHGRPMYPSRLRTIELMADLSDDSLCTLIDAILQAPEGPHASTLVYLVDHRIEDETKFMLTPRGPTGVRAEEAFCRYHSTTGLPVTGQLRDRRQEACGYDFEIKTPDGIAAVEVKGLAGSTGGVSFTDKEWRVAGHLGKAYYLAVVRNTAAEPEVDIIRNPAQALFAVMRTFTTVQIGWSVAEVSLRAAERGQPHQLSG